MIKPNDLPPIPDGHPHVYPATPAPTWKYPMPTQPNIELRDWFAGMAMQGFCASHSWSNETVARESYLLADALLKARGAR